MRELQSINLVENSSGMWGSCCCSSGVDLRGLSGTEADAITSKALNDFVQSVLDEVSDHRPGRSAPGIAGN